MAGYKVHRYHDISCGHRVHGHEGKCRHLHGHNYRVHFTCVMDTAKQSQELGATRTLDDIGRVIDFSVVKEKLCMWIEDHWDHKFLAWKEDPLLGDVVGLYADHSLNDASKQQNRSQLLGSIVWTPFNPTAENMAQYLVDVVGPEQLAGTGVKLVEVIIEETAKCHASYGA
jgi:6-pyruvoyltetrahydropterin/6-carboxytetrahydropterin synthase